jgi:hypothetical protein
VVIDQLWSAIEALPEPQSDATRQSKQDEVIAALAFRPAALLATHRRLWVSAE